MQSRARGGDDLRTATIDTLYNDGSASGKRRRPGEEPSSEETAEPPRSTEPPRVAPRAPPCSAPPPPVAVLAIDIETHGWVDEEHSVARWIGHFGKSAWRSQRQLEFSRVVQLGIVAFDASGRLIARREMCVSDAPPCQTSRLCALQGPCTARRRVHGRRALRGPRVRRVRRSASSMPGCTSTARSAQRRAVAASGPAPSCSPPEARPIAPRRTSGNPRDE